MSSLIEKIAPTDHTILITGRTGTGKSHLARVIHDASKRRDGKFVAINLATLSENLIESELFGHERGAFSGAETKRIGKLEWANGGTVFLDEIGELSTRLQTKLLEALNSYTISPVGSNREIALNIRIIAATNRNLPKMIALGTFREDLFFRMNTFEVKMPDLIESPEKIRFLAETFAKESAGRQGKEYRALSAACLKVLENYSWPGNVRELKNCLEFCVAMNASGIIEESDLPSYIKQPHNSSSNSPQDAPFPCDYREAKAQFERTYFGEILKRYQGRINFSARKTGISKVTLIEKIRRYEIDIRKIKLESHRAIN